MCEKVRATTKGNWLRASLKNECDSNAVLNNFDWRTKQSNMTNKIIMTNERQREKVIKCEKKKPLQSW